MKTKPKITSGVYLIRNLRTGEKYVGISYDLEKRRWQHFAALRCGGCMLPLLQASFTPWSEDDFSFKVLEECVGGDGGREMHWIYRLRPSLNRQIQKQDGIPRKVFTFACHQSLLDALEEYRRKHGERSMADVVRKVISEVIDYKPYCTMKPGDLLE